MRNSADLQLYDSELQTEGALMMKMIEGGTKTDSMYAEYANQKCFYCITLKGTHAVMFI